VSQGPETRFIASVHRQLPPNQYFMKNHNAYIGGPADVWYSGEIGDIWIEYKYVKTLPKSINLMDTKKKYALSALQQEWLHDRYAENRKVFVVLGCMQGGVVLGYLDWEVVHDSTVVLIKSRTDIAKWISYMTKGSYAVPSKRGKRVERCV
jgi:hypothetical protein